MKDNLLWFFSFGYYDYIATVKTNIII